MSDNNDRDSNNNTMNPASIANSRQNNATRTATVPPEDPDAWVALLNKEALIL